MQNSDLRKHSRPLKSGEAIEEGDLYWSYVEDRITWMEICESYTGKEYDAATMCPMRRPITNSMEFITHE